MPEWIESALAMRIGYVLVHSLWEGAGVCVLAGVVLWMLRRGSAAVRYGVAAAALAGMVVAPVVTFWVLQDGTPERQAARIAVMMPGPRPVPNESLSNKPAPSGGTVAPTANTGGGAGMPTEIPAATLRAPAVRPSWLEASLPYAVLVWAVGVVLLSLWHFGGWVAVQRLRVVETRRTSAAVEAVLARLAARLGVRRRVRILESLRAEVPMLLGVWKPLILMPPAMLLGLAPGQLEAILAHELAHIRRYDYVVLLLQRVAETLLFYHPGVWWLSRRMRLEQEQCCDDLALSVVGDRRAYAGALAAIEEIRLAGATPATALAATGNSARELMMRIARLLGLEAPRAPRRARVAGAAVLVSTLLLAALILALATLQPAFAQAVKPSFTLGKGTTVITSPLNADGTPDYVRAVNAQYSQGVTPENNAFAAWIEASGSAILLNPEGVDAKARDQMLALAGAKPAAAAARKAVFDPYLVYVEANYPGRSVAVGEDQTLLRHALWSVAQHPEFGAFLKAEGDYLDQIATASARPRWWCPMAGKDGRTMYQATASHYSLMGMAREITNDLCARATLRAEAGDFDGFLGDVMATKQIARHFGGDPTLVSRLVGIAIDGVANDAIGTVAASGRLSEAQCGRLAKALGALAPLQPMAETVDRAERYLQLDLFLLIATDKIALIPDVDPAMFGAIDRAAMDWDTALRQVNRAYDEIAVAMQEPSLAAMKRRIAAAEQAAKGHLDAKTPEEAIAAFKQRTGEMREAYAQRVAGYIMANFMPALAKPEEMHRQALLRDDMLNALIAAAGVKAKTGQWPERLETLLPGALKEIPKDIYSADEQAPVRYAVTGGQARIYSLGAMGRDDGRLNVGVRPPAASGTGTAPSPVETKPAADFTVNVKELANGKPVEGALVKIRSTNFNAEKVTDGAGTVRLPRKEDAEWLVVEVSGQDWVPMATLWHQTLDAGTLPEKFEFVMEKGKSIGGVVVDETGAPLAGAKVMLMVNKKYAGSSQVLDVQDIEIPTNDAGRWTFTGVPAAFDSIELAAMHPECLDQYGFYVLKDFKDVAGLLAGSAKLVLSRGVPIDLVVRDADGQPVNNAMVGYGNDRNGSNMMGEMPVHAGGVLRLGVQEGTEAVFTVRAAGWAPELKRVKVGSRPVKVVVDLQRPQTLSGQVVDSGGKPVAGARIYPDSWRGARTLIGAEIRTDGAGRFTWEGAPADEIKVDILAAGFAAARQVAVKAGAANIVTMPSLTRFTGTVVDAVTGAPVTGFRVVDGIDFREGRPPSWNGTGSTRLKSAGAGSFTIDFDEARYPGMIVRVEADGYSPAESPSIALDGKNTQFTFKLEKGAMIEGTLLGAGGKPVANTKVFLASKGQTLEVVDGNLLDQRELQSASTDAAGHFKFVPQKDSFVMMVMSDAGYALCKRKEFEKAHTLKLEPWARIEGEARQGTHAVPQAKINVWYDRLPEEFPADDVQMSLESGAVTDAAGRFVLERVFGESLLVGRKVSLGGGTTTTNWNVHLTPKPGETLKGVIIGGQGRPVMGRIQVPAGMEPSEGLEREGELRGNSTGISWSPPVDVMEMNAADAGRWWTAWNASAEGKQAAEAQREADAKVHYFNFPIAADGTFRVDDVPAGVYTLDVTFFRAANPAKPGDVSAKVEVIQTITVGEVSGGVSDEPMDLGVLSAQWSRPLVVGDVVPPVAFPTGDGKVVALADFRGKYLLVDMWHSAGPLFMPDVAALQEVWEGHPDGRLAIVCVAYDTHPEGPVKYAAAKKFPWVMTQSGLMTLLPRLMPLGRDGSTATLIGPDGKVLAVHLQGEGIKAAVEKAMGK